jgi:hypothetical protein
MSPTTKAPKSQRISCDYGNFSVGSPPVPPLGPRTTVQLGVLLKDRNAPITAIGRASIEPVKSTLNRRSHWLTATTVDAPKMVYRGGCGSRLADERASLL